MKLYQIAGEIQSTMLQIEECEEWAPEIADALNAVTAKLDEKLERVQQFRINLEADADACKAEAKRLTDRAKANMAKSEGLRDYIKHCLLLAGIQKVRTPLFSFSISPTTAIEVANINELPEQYRRVKTSVEADKETIRMDIAAGAEVPPGVEIKEGWKLSVR